ncbi:hypothetical protein [Halonotius roseus]|uniref:Uncharacterized protein n=1 Tax=Halonotius roseus TaxID=2511997 RepID=A0A544QQY8_9EURY|nr:hypothetical protein [Halonotius roseus]TQQ81841.1 hypothetical protein EWF95_02585 [Halonotius roseus]
MANYTTELKTWGDTGSEYPTGYSYLENEQPVDAWDNFSKYNIIEDLKHLVSLTNDRIESDSGVAGGEPTSPDAAHLFHDTDNETLAFWNATTDSWSRLLTVDGATLGGDLDMGDNALLNVGTMTFSGALQLSGQSIKDSADLVYDSTTGQVGDADTLDGMHAADLGSSAFDDGILLVESAGFDFGANLSVTDNGDATVTIDAAEASDTQSGISEDGTQMYASVDDINFTGFLNVIDDGDGSVTIDPTHNHDLRYLQPGDADSLYLQSDQGNEIHVGTTAPSNPSTNDIWIDLS